MRDLEAEIDWCSKDRLDSILAYSYSLAFNSKGSREDAVVSIKILCEKSKWGFESFAWGVSISSNRVGLSFDWEMIDEALKDGMAER